MDVPQYNNEFYMPSIYTNRKNARGSTLDVGNLLNLKEQRGVPNDEIVIQSNRQLKKPDARDLFTKALRQYSRKMEGEKGLQWFNELIQSIPEFDQLNMHILAYARLFIEENFDKNITRDNIVDKFNNLDDKELDNIKNLVQNQNYQHKINITYEQIKIDLLRYIIIIEKFVKVPKVLS